jgi:uncharacterized protein
MPDSPISYPGVYIEEIPFSGRTIQGVATSTTAFVGGSVRGPTDRPRLVTSFTEFERRFGGLSATFPMGHAVRQFFENGGRRALICRVRGARRGARPTNAEIVERGLPLLDRATEVVNLVAIPPIGQAIDVDRETWTVAATWAKRNRAMLIVDPPEGWGSAADVTAGAVDALIAPSEDLTNAALYFPWLLAPDPLAGNRPVAFAPSGAVCGIYARTDVNRGVWRAPAGPDGGVQGVTGLAVDLTQSDSEALTPRGINTIRSFPGRRAVVWGARTLRGADAHASDWKYVPVRRFFLFIEESIDRGIQWAVFEPNAEPLWLELTRHIGNFLSTLFAQGAFPANRPQEAFFVRCDRTTMTLNDIDNGSVIVLIGIAPVKPAEFVIFRIGISARPPT